MNWRRHSVIDLNTENTLQIHALITSGRGNREKCSRLRFCWSVDELYMNGTIAALLAKMLRIELDALEYDEIQSIHSELYKRTAVVASQCRWTSRKQMDSCVWVALQDGRPSWDPNTETFRFLTHSSVLITQAFWCASPESLFPIIYMLAIHLFLFLSLHLLHLHSLVFFHCLITGRETDGEPCDGLTEAA